MRKTICILGSTGSIGRSSLDVIANFPEAFRVAHLSANTNVELLGEQIDRFRPDGVTILDPCAEAPLRNRVDGTVAVGVGADALCDVVAQGAFDIVISSLVGFAGLRPTIEAVRRGKTVALANKETLVAAGELITALAAESGARIVPIDSEHSAIMQCLAGENPAHVARLILTASGGPFLRLPKAAFPDVTVEDALRHPNWTMGNKITIDSATLMNKGLEVIEAHWLFGLPPEKIDVLVHPQSIIHSMVEFVDGSVKAQLGVPDMKIPIQVALTYPDRAPSPFARVDFARLGTMTFAEPDREKFECLALAYEALRCGGTAPAILNAANEVAVDLFLHRRLKFHEIPRLIRRALGTIPVVPSPTIGEIIEADALTRTFVRSDVLTI